MAEQIAQNNYLIQQQALNSQYRQAFATYQKYLQALAYYETSALPNATIIASTANKQFLGGDINYLEWVLLINQAISIRSEYIEALRSLNQTTIQLNNFSNR